MRATVVVLEPVDTGLRMTGDKLVMRVYIHRDSAL